MKTCLVVFSSGGHCHWIAAGMETNIRDYAKPETHANVEHSIMQTLNTTIIYFHLNYIPGHSVIIAQHFGHFNRNSNQMEFQNVGKDHLLFVCVCLTEHLKC